MRFSDFAKFFAFLVPLKLPTEVNSTNNHRFGSVNFALSFIIDKGEGVVKVLAAGELLAVHLVPHYGVDSGEAGVALHPHANVGDVEFVGKGHRLAVYLATADDKYLLLALAHRQGCLQRGSHLATLNTQFAIACDDNVAAAGQGSPDALVGLTPHNDRVTESHSFEVRKIFGYVPGHSAARTYNAVLCHGNYQREFGFHIVCKVLSI